MTGIAEAPRAVAVRERLTGVEALVRVVVEQADADYRAGLRTGGFVTGYPGSPLGRVQDTFESAADQLTPRRIVFSPGLNEELAATAVWGSQTVEASPDATVDGVFGMWFGKAPGVDRAGDALRHGNLRGTARHGGVLVVAGDDPKPNATVFPSDSTAAFTAWGMPVLFPATVQDVVDLGRHGYALSRAAGLWVGLKIVTEVADGTGTVAVEPLSPRIPSVTLDGATFVPQLRLNEAGVPMQEAERDLYAARLRLAAAYIRDNELNPVTVDPPHARVGVVAAGPAYLALRAALRRLGLDDADLHERGIRLKKVTALHPICDDEWAAFADGLSEIVVVEEKRPLLEDALKRALYDRADRPTIVGKSDELFAPHGEIDAALIARRLGPWLSARFPMPVVEPQRPAPVLLPLTTARTGFFCSGCPHNTGLKAPQDATVAAGIGCHLLGLFGQRPEHGKMSGYTQMGGEGAQWVGMAPFTSTGHIVQNVGDGTFHHSASLALRLAISSGVNVTYKILFNGTVGMTGGQDVRGGMDVPALTRMLLAEGVRQIVVTSDAPGKYRRRSLPRGVRVRPREDIVVVQEELATVPGVTVLIHDQLCAAEKRREQRRTGVTPSLRIMIAERVCEGCGDCNAASQCLSVRPVETEFGRRNTIDQSSCTQDATCVDGDCPSFLTVDVSRARKGGTRAPEPPSVPEPTPLVDREEFTVHMTGIGGAGIVSVGRMLAAAAGADGRGVRSLDLTGATIKAGPVVSQLQVYPGAQPPAAIGAGGADVFLGFDLLAAMTPSTIAPMSPERTVVVASDAVEPTARMAVDPSAPAPDVAAIKKEIDARSRAEHNVYLDAPAVAEALFGTTQPATTLLVGAAVQAGALPLRPGAVEDALREQGVAVEQNLAAFAWGRVAVADPTVVERLMFRPDTTPEPDERSRRLIASLQADGELLETLQRTVPDLVHYQGHAYARRYVDAVADIDDQQLATIAARTLHRLMAYKDEYEVARLHLLESSREAVEAEFGEGARVSWNLHPPVLRYLGMDRKIRLGPWFRPAFSALRAVRRVRGTAIDPFGRARVRRVERALVEHYLDLCRRMTDDLTADNHAARCTLAAAAGEIRGYEEIKMDAVARYVETARSLAAEAGVAFDTGALAAAGKEPSWTSS